MKATKETRIAEVFVLSQDCTTTFPDLGLELPAGEVVQIPATYLDRVLRERGVVQAHLDPSTPLED